MSSKYNAGHHFHIDCLDMRYLDMAVFGPEGEAEAKLVASQRFGVSVFKLQAFLVGATWVLELAA